MPMGVPPMMTWPQPAPAKGGVSDVNNVESEEPEVKIVEEEEEDEDFYDHH